MKIFCFAIVLFQFIFNLSYSQEITGDWYGIIDVSGKSQRIILHLSVHESGYSGMVDWPDQDDFGIPMDKLLISNDSFSFKLDQQNFKGLISRTLQAIIGVWNYPVGSIALSFGRKKIQAPEGSIVHIRNQYDNQEKYITMRDGVRLFTSIYTPKDQTISYPILLIRTPYNSKPSKDKYNIRLTNLTHLLQEKYIIVFQDVRGRFMSEGKFVDVRPFKPNKKRKEIDENSDTYDTIDWLIKNVDNNNGNVGIFGISYRGFYSTMALPNAHPALKAVSPQAPVTNWFLGDDFHHNGAFFLSDAFSFYSYFGRPRPALTRIKNDPFQYENEDNYDFFIDIGPIKNVQKKHFGDSIKFWAEMMKHPNYDEFWQERNVLPHLTDIKPAVLVVGGWFDAEDLYGALKTYEAIETQNKENNQNRLIMGPWFHGQWLKESGENLGNIHFGSKTSDYIRDVELRFFNYYLKDKGKMDVPEASIFISGVNEWRTFESWPPADVEHKNLYLDCNEQLSFVPSKSEACFEEYVVDPNKPVPYTEDVHMIRTKEYLTDDQRFASRRPDVMVYQTDVLEEDVTIIGPLKVNLFVSTTGTDADYVVKMIDVFPDQVKDYPKNDRHVPMGGYQMLVRGEVMRGKFRNSFEKPEPFLPNQVTEVSFEIPDLAHQFKKGHRIMIQVQNSWFPLVDINPQKFVNIYEAEEKDFIKATHRIYHDEQRPSSISVGILKNK